jgi:hypothetical protein
MEAEMSETRRIEKVVVTNAVIIGASERANKVTLNTGDRTADQRRYLWMPKSRCSTVGIRPKPTGWRKGKSCTLTIPGWLWAKMTPRFRTAAEHKIHYAEVPVPVPAPVPVDDGTDEAFAARRARTLKTTKVGPMRGAADPVFQPFRKAMSKTPTYTIRELESHYAKQRRTKVIAVRCCVCNRDLIDNASIEAGMGPTCRKAHADKLDKAKAARAKKLIWIAATTGDKSLIQACIEKLHKIGANKVADRLAANIADVKVSYVGDAIHVETPRYDPELVSAIKRVPQRQFAKFDKVTGERLPRDSHERGRAVWTVPQTREAALWLALTQAIGGKFGQDVTGLFNFPKVA